MCVLLSVRSCIALHRNAVQQYSSNHLCSCRTWKPPHRHSISYTWTWPLQSSYWPFTPRTKFNNQWLAVHGAVISGRGIHYEAKGHEIIYIRERSLVPFRGWVRKYHLSDVNHLYILLLLIRHIILILNLIKNTFSKNMCHIDGEGNEIEHCTLCWRWVSYKLIA